MSCQTFTIRKHFLKETRNFAGICESFFHQRYMSLKTKIYAKANSPTRQNEMQPLIPLVRAASFCFQHIRVAKSYKRPSCDITSNNRYCYREKRKVAFSKHFESALFSMFQTKNIKKTLWM